MNSEALNVIHRYEIPILQEVEVDGIIQFLGEHRDFRNEENLNKFISKETNTSLSWTHLKPGEQLNVHVHPVKSMIIICSGKGMLLGEYEKELVEGDVVIVPPNVKHGFRGIDKNGFHALSVQFDSKSLYTRGEKPTVTFIEEREIYKKEFLRYNQERIDRHLNLPIFNIIKNGTFENEECTQKLCSFLKTWSSYFQKLVMLRVVTSTTSPYADIAKQHLSEEFGHDSLLEDKVMNDLSVKSISTWFVHQMMCRSDLEKHLIVHSVLEKGAHCFHDLCAKHLRSKNSSYFNVHVEHDGDHSEMGFSLILESYQKQKDLILNTLEEAWLMLDLLFNHAYKIITNGLRLERSF